jgi:hypothetical protein
LPSNNTTSTCIGDGSGESWTSGNVHASKKDRVVDLQEIGGDGSDLLCLALAYFHGN